MVTAGAGQRSVRNAALRVAGHVPAVPHAMARRLAGLDYD